MRTGGPIPELTLELLGTVSRQISHDLARGPLRIGRASGNELCLTDPEVSGYHAVIAEVGGGVLLTDLRTTNGTSVDGEVARRPTPLFHGSVIALGEGSQLLVGLTGRSVIGSEGQERDLPGTTLRSSETSFPYLVTTSIDGDGPPFARFEVEPGGLVHRVTAENRAILVYLLARQLGRQRGDRTHASGWCADGDIRVGIWGPTARNQLANNLNVIIGRTRKELTAHGFSGACIQKVHGHTRLWVEAVKVA